MNKTLLIALTTSLALSMVTLPASARDEIITKSQVVRYGDLNLSSDEGVRALYHRIRKAARKVCTEANDSVQLQQRSFRVCVDSAVANAVDKVNRPALTAMHTKSPRPLG